jgi:hypothetical protein
MLFLICGMGEKLETAPYDSADVERLCNMKK